MQTCPGANQFERIGRYRVRIPDPLPWTMLQMFLVYGFDLDRTGRRELLPQTLTRLRARKLVMVQIWKWSRNSYFKASVTSIQLGRTPAGLQGVIELGAPIAGDNLPKKREKPVLTMSRRIRELERTAVRLHKRIEALENHLKQKRIEKLQRW